MPLSRAYPRLPFPANEFADVLAANRSYVHEPTHVSGTAARGLAIVTCMDSRIAPLAITGMQPGDAKILRNAGARATYDVQRSLVLATHLLGVTRILVMPHTDCKMASGDEAAIHQAIYDASAVDTRSIEISTVADQRAALVTDIVRLRSLTTLKAGTVVGGAIYDVDSGELEPIEA
jgi:carbonic anhydrase